jgi:hypothetical protein
MNLWTAAAALRLISSRVIIYHLGPIRLWSIACNEPLKRFHCPYSCCQKRRQLEGAPLGIALAAAPTRMKQLLLSFPSSALRVKFDSQFRLATAMGLLVKQELTLAIVQLLFGLYKLSIFMALPLLKCHCHIPQQH